MPITSLVYKTKIINKFETKAMNLYILLHHISSLLKLVFLNIKPKI